MNIKPALQGLRATGLALIAALAIGAPMQADAQSHGGSAVGHGGGFHGGALRAGPGYRGGYGWRGGYGYWRGGYGYGYGWWGWPAYGLFLGALPYYYSTVWWNGVPYYYADDSYYVWNGAAGAYESVAPPGQATNQAGAPTYMPQGASELFAYPRHAQSDEQQARDKQECRTWADTQAGAGSASPTAHGDNLRAQTACLEARGYSVK